MCHSLDQKASVGTTPGTGFIHDDSGSGNGFAWIKLNDLIVFSCYWSPNTTLAEYETFLGNLEQAIRARGDTRLIVAGDFNAWNVEWGSRVDNPRGELLSDLAASLDLILDNVGDTPTFVRGDATSIIDVTFSKGVGVCGWSVLDELNLSDHAYVAFSIDLQRADPLPRWPQVDAPPGFHPGWALKKFDRESFYRHVSSRPLTLSRDTEGGNSAVRAAESLDNYIIEACDVSMPLRSPRPGGRRPMYWWTDHIADLRSKALSLRRTYQSCLRRHGPEGAAEAKANFSAARRDLRREIRKSKEQGWRELCAQIDINPWGQPYKLVMKKFGDGSSRLASKGRELVIADHLFPAAPVTDWNLMPEPAVRNIFDNFDPDADELIFNRVIPEFTIDELTMATKKMSTGKAGGPSGIPNEILKRIVAARPEATLNIYNECLKALTFPSNWKKAKLVLLHKGPDKPVEAPSSFRPICLLDTPGKLLERLLLQRLDTHLDSSRSGRASNQFGFRKGISTVSAVEVVTKLASQAASGTWRQKKLCVLVTLDVKNAFNSLQWPVIDEALRNKGTPEYLVLMIRSWLSERQLLVGDQRNIKTVTCGVPQGSVLGPTLWNVAYDYLLDMEVSRGVQLIGFADDLAVVGVAKTGEELEELVNPTLEKIDQWMTSRGLQLAHHKTEAVMLTKKWAFNPPRLSIGGSPIQLSSQLRYLGVILDSRLSFVKHAESIAKKAANSALALSRLMPNISGPCQWKRRLLGSVVESQLLYAAPIWSAAASSTAKSRKILRRPQRVAALRAIRAYRTVSDEAAFVLASMPPVDLLAEERSRIKARLAEDPPPGAPPPSRSNIKKEERTATIADWQRKWTETDKASWTRRLIPNIARWENRTTPRIPWSYHMTQALSGHGCFQWYLRRMGRAPSPRCMHCQCGSDTAEHTIFHCPNWDSLRDELRARLGHPPEATDGENILCGPLLEDLPTDQTAKATVLNEAEETFRLFYKMVEEILTLKEIEERARQAADAAVV